MIVLLRPTLMLRVAKRTVASGGPRAQAKRAPAAAAAAAAAISRGAHAHREGINVVSAEEQAAVARDEAAGQRKLQRGAIAQHSISKNNSSSSGSKPAAPSKADAAISAASSFVPDYRERVLQIFQRLAEINNALQERYKAQSYQIAVDNLKRDDFIFLNLPPNIMPPGVDDAQRQRLLDAVNATPAVGDKLKAKMVEILSTGDLAELHSLQAKPIIRAIQELTQVHGVGPRTAVTFYKKYGLKSVAELQQRVKEQEAENSSSSSCCTSSGGAKKAVKKKASSTEGATALHLTEAQRLGLKYHGDITQRIPHDEVRLHEAFLKLRLRKYLGKGYELSVCGSYRRRQPTSGDIDVLITRKTNVKEAAARRGKHARATSSSGGNEGVLAPQEVLAAFVAALQQERYIEATLAQGQTKFMGVSRLKSYNYNAGATSPKLYPARRLDIRFVEPECYPAAMLYFTGSKNFNVVMRAEAIKLGYVLNEYGLFRNDAAAASASSAAKSGEGRGSTSSDRGRWNAEAFQKLVRAQYYSAKSPAFVDDCSSDDEDDDDAEAAEDAGKKRGKTGRLKQKASQQQQQELAALWREVEARRVKVKHERDIFDVLGMTYVHPENREV